VCFVVKSDRKLRDDPAAKDTIEMSGDCSQGRVRERERERGREVIRDPMFTPSKQNNVNQIVIVNVIERGERERERRREWNKNQVIENVEGGRGARAEETIKSEETRRR
jgi:hypothetical protein